MDPLSITSAAVALASRCWCTGKEIYDTIEKYHVVLGTLQLLVDITDVTNIALLAINRHLAAHPISALSPELEDIFHRAIKGFEAVLLCLEKEFFGLKENENWWNRVKNSMEGRYDGKTVEELGTETRSSDSHGNTESVRDRCTHLVLCTFNWHRVSREDRRSLLQEHRSELIDANSDMNSLVEEYPHVVPSIVEEADNMSLRSIITTRESVFSTTEFSFDGVLLNTTLYRDTLKRLVVAASLKPATDPSPNGQIISHGHSLHDHLEPYPFQKPPSFRPNILNMLSPRPTINLVPRPDPRNRVTKRAIDSLADELDQTELREILERDRRRREKKRTRDTERLNRKLERRGEKERVKESLEGAQKKRGSASTSYHPSNKGRTWYH